MTAKLFLMLVVVVACDDVKKESDEDYWKRRAREDWEAPCADESRLLATTAGSPDGFKCPNKAHRMQVQIATTSSNEEIGAIVFCKCARPEDRDQ